MLLTCWACRLAPVTAAIARDIPAVPVTVPHENHPSCWRDGVACGQIVDCGLIGISYEPPELELCPPRLGGQRTNPATLMLKVRRRTEPIRDQVFGSCLD